MLKWSLGIWKSVLAPAQFSLNSPGGCWLTASLCAGTASRAGCSTPGNALNAFSKEQDIASFNPNQIKSNQNSFKITMG